MANWDEEFDLIVVGSGAGGMTAALVGHDRGLNSIVLEKSNYYGGTTALSGGVIWVPNSHLLRATQIQDSHDDAIAYLKHVTKGEVRPQRIEAYVQQAPQMLKYLEQHSHVKFEAADKYCDYYPDAPGGKMGARSLDPRPFNRKKLGKEADHQQPHRWHGIYKRLSLTAKEAHIALELNWRGTLLVMYRLARYYLDLSSRWRGLPNARLALGGALVARLRRSLMDRKVPVQRHTDVKQLIVEQGRVVGVQVEQQGQIRHLRAKYGLVMASGGFAHNVDMRQQYQAMPIGNEWTSACETDQGDGIRMGQRVGAEVEFMHCAWWTPAIRQPDQSIWALIVGKAMPGSIFVNQQGQRFTNEAAPYEDVVKGLYQAHSAENPSIPAYMIFDATYRQKYAIGGMVPPARVKPDHLLSNQAKSPDFMAKANSLAELAALIGTDSEVLQQTITNHNNGAKKSQDPLFGRGGSAVDRYYSDTNHQPNPCLAPIERAPFYAVKVYPGDLGTKGGLACDEYARVLDQQGNAIDGFYATGNCSGAVMGDSYPGAGATIGPAMTFGYIAAHHVADQMSATT